MTENPDKLKCLLTVADVAKWLTVSSSLVYQLVESGKLPVYRIGNGRGSIRFRPEDIEGYLNTCRSERMPVPAQPKIRPRLKHLRID